MPKISEKSQHISLLFDPKRKRYSDAYIDQILEDRERILNYSVELIAKIDLLKHFELESKIRTAECDGWRIDCELLKKRVIELESQLMKVSNNDNDQVLP